MKKQHTEKVEEKSQIPVTYYFKISIDEEGEPHGSIITDPQGVPVIGSIVITSTTPLKSK